MNGLKYPIKRYKLRCGFDDSIHLSIACKKHTSPSRTNITLGIKDGKRIFQAHGTRKQAGKAFGISEKIDFKL